MNQDLKLLTLQCSPIDGDGGMSFSLSLPIVDNQLLCSADIEMEVDSRTLTSSDQTDDSHIVSKLDIGVGGHPVRHR